MRYQLEYWSTTTRYCEGVVRHIHGNLCGALDASSPDGDNIPLQLCPTDKVCRLGQHAVLALLSPVMVLQNFSLSVHRHYHPALEQQDPILYQQAIPVLKVGGQSGTGHHVPRPCPKQP